MRRSTGISGLFSLLRATSASAIVLAIVVSCSESTAPEMRMPDGVTFVQVLVSDSLKNFLLNESSASLLNAPVDVSANLLVPAGVARSLSASAAGWVYSVSHVPFNVETIPGIIIPKDNWLVPTNHFNDGDGYMQDIPLGFSFNFYGNTYDKVNIYANGFLQFGPPQTDPSGAGFFMGRGLKTAALPNNIIAFAWTDWSPQAVDGGVRFETRGTAPNRRFLLQFNNVPERSPNTGLLMMQLVLDEATNSITIYTNTMRITKTLQRITQGIENEDGTLAAFDTFVNPISGVTSPRVANFFSLTNDAVRFSPPRPPVVTAPKDTVVLTAPPAPSANRLAFSITPAIGSCVASFTPAVATATDDISVVSLVGVRSDDASLALDAPYPKGVTTITWTATDNDGMTASATQLITVVDKELPWIAAPASDSADNDPHLPSAVVALGSAESADNCPNVSVSSKRSDGAPIDAPFMVGITTITWTATDASLNSASATQSIKVKDVEAPSLSVPLDTSVKATSPSGAVFKYLTHAEDNVAVSSLSCSRASGAVFPIGANTIKCTAADAAGNSTSASFSVNVIDALTQMRMLSDYVGGLPMPEGTTNPLVNQLQAAVGSYPGDQACKKLNDFVNMVSKKARDIPAGQAEYLIGEATTIMNVMGCSTDKRSPAILGKA